MPSSCRGLYLAVTPEDEVIGSAVVAAGAVVRADVPARTIVAGVPARIIKKVDQGA